MIKMRIRILLILVLTLLMVSCMKQADTVSETTAPEYTVSEDTQEQEEQESRQIKFDYPPTEIDKILFIYPLGFMFGSHVTPVDHQYYVESSYGEPEGVLEVYSPADGVIKSIQHMSSLPGETGIEIDDYRLVIEHTSAISTIFIHVDELSEKIAEFAPPGGEYSNVSIAVQAGEVIGSYGGSFDFNVVDRDIILDGLLVPESYEAEEWKIHVKDPFEYFNEPVKSMLIEKCLRTEDPIGGKIDYDIDGKLVGTWFLKNTNKYRGIGDQSGAYYAGHLSIAYDYIDPEHIIISFGSYEGESRQFAVVDNGPDPAGIGAGDPVAYELVSYDYFIDDTRWDRESLVKGLKVKNNEGEVMGTVLFELIEDRTLKMEIFDGKTADDISGFTDGALIYER